MTKEYFFYHCNTLKQRTIVRILQISHVLQNNYKQTTYSFPRRGKFRTVYNERKRNGNGHLFSLRKIILIVIKYIHQSCHYTLYILSPKHTFSKYLVLKKDYWICHLRGAWVARSVRCPTLNLNPGLDLTVVSLSPIRAIQGHDVCWKKKKSLVYFSCICDLRTNGLNITDQMFTE